MSRRLQSAGALTVFVFLIGAATASAQSGGARGASTSGTAPTVKVALTPLFAPPGDSAAAQIAGAATNALKLMLHLAGSLTVVDAGKLDPIMGYPQAVAYYRRIGARVGMFGTVTPGAGSSYTITVQYWRSAKPTAPPATFKRSVSTTAAAAKAGDELAVKVASAVADRKLSAGTVEVKNTEGLPSFSIYADGHLAARNSSTVRLLAGSRRITVEVENQGTNHPIESFNVDVKAGTTTTVALSASALAATSKKPSSAPHAASASPPQTAQRPTPSGSLTVTSSPAGASVLIDGKPMGITPVRLSKVAVGSHRLRITKSLFLPVVRHARVLAKKVTAIHVKLTVDRRDPAIAARLLSPVGVGGSSLLWSAMQTARFAGILATAGTGRAVTSSFLSTRQAFGSGGPGLETFLDLDLDLLLTRIGGRLAGDATLTRIGDVWAAAAAAAVTTSLVAAERSSTLQQSQVWQNVALAAAGAAIGGMVFDAGSSALAASDADKRLLSYVSSHGTLPPARRPPEVHPHEVILETGGGSLVRVGFLQPLVPSYLSFEESVGLGTETSSSFQPMLTGGAILSYNPWGATTGRLRPEVFTGVRATTNFTTAGSSIEPEFGTGNDWIGKSFDIFTRGGLGYDVASAHWDEFFSIGTRIF